METKVCIECSIKKPLSDFYFNEKTQSYNKVFRTCEYLIRRQSEKSSIKKKLQEENEEMLRHSKKKCNICLQIKDLSEFYYRSDLKQYRNWCIECEKKRTNRFYNENKETILKKQHQFYKDNQKIMLERKKEFAESHKNQLRTYHRNYIHNRRKNDDIFRFKSQIRHLINQSFRRQGKQKKRKTEKIVGCDFQTLCYYLLDTYKQIYGIEWDGIEKVHIDHISSITFTSFLYIN